ncbi:hypothetical protein D1872_216490 [compost metagenome]
MNKYILFYESKGVIRTLCLEVFETLEEAKRSAIEKIKSGYSGVRLAQNIPITIEVKIQGGEEQ